VVSGWSECLLQKYQAHLDHPGDIVVQHPDQRFVIPDQEKMVSYVERKRAHEPPQDLLGVHAFQIAYIHLASKNLFVEGSAEISVQQALAAVRVSNVSIALESNAIRYNSLIDSLAV
jgi:hypothetical protein